MEIDGVSILVILLVIIALLVLFYFANKRYGLVDSWILTIKRLAPLWLIFFPAFITYFFVCGALSAITFTIYGSITGKNFDPDFYFGLENWVEYICSFFMPLIYFKVLAKRKFPAFWPIVITLVHSLVAGYRDAKLVPAADHDSPVPYQSGPKIFVQFQWVDALVPLLSLLVFYFVFKKKWQNTSQTIN